MEINLSGGVRATTMENMNFLQQSQVRAQLVGRRILCVETGRAQPLAQVFLLKCVCLKHGQIYVENYIECGGSIIGSTMDSRQDWFHRNI